MVKRLLVVDHWHNVSGGASKAALFAELCSYYDLEFVRVEVPRHINLFGLASTFSPDVRRWKQQRARFQETVQKRPHLFRLLTKLYSKAVRQLVTPYDAVLQIGSLFGPIENPRGAPYFSYSDSTVKNPALMWPDWMPEGFASLAEEWYGLETSYFRSLDGALFYSRWAADTAVSGYGVDSRKVHVVGSALKMSREYEVDWSRREQRVVFVSTDFKRKGGYELPAIFSEVLHRVPAARLVIVGDVPPDFRFRAPWLEIKGSVAREQLVEIYRGASILLHPAKYDPFPSVILEAANLEMPAVASAICGIPEMIRDGDTGYLVPPADLPVFVDRLARLLTDRERCRAMGAAAKMYVRDRFSPPRVASNVARVISTHGPTANMNMATVDKPGFSTVRQENRDLLR